MSTVVKHDVNRKTTEVARTVVRVAVAQYMLSLSDRMSLLFLPSMSQQSQAVTNIACGI